MDFNTITKEQEDIVKAKFLQYGKGVVIGNYLANNADESSAKWADLIDPKKYNLNAIKTKMLEVARLINTTCNDSVLGDLTIAFTFETERGKRVSITYLEIYTFLRAAFKYRKESEEYVSKAKEMKELKKFIEENKSKEDKLAEAMKKVEALSKELSE